MDIGPMVHKPNYIYYQYNNHPYFKNTSSGIITITMLLFIINLTTVYMAFSEIAFSSHMQIDSDYLTLCILTLYFIL